MRFLEIVLKTRVVKFPRFYEEQDDHLPYFVSTTVFVDVREVSRFFTILSLQFAGRRKLMQKEIQ